MRFFIIGLFLLLVSCASPQKNPESFTGGVYTPGTIDVESNGSFIALASVLSESNKHQAEKAAYGRLLVAARSGGYKYFSIRSEKTSKSIAVRFTISGRLYKEWVGGVELYPVSSISKVLRGKSLGSAVKRTVPKPKAVNKAATKSASKPATLPKPTPQAEPDVADPLVILAPTDITGSIRKPANDNINPAMDGMLVKKPSISGFEKLQVPNALSGTPTGVIIQSN